LAGPSKASEIEGAASSALGGVTEWKEQDLLQPSGHEFQSLYYELSSSRSMALQLGYLGNDGG